MAISREEIRRKLLHLFALLMPAAILYAPRWSWPDIIVPGILFMLFALSVIVEMLRFKIPLIQRIVLKSFGSMMRKEEHVIVSGWTWVIGAAFLCSVLFKEHPYIAFAALSLFIIGDAVAALVGIGLGRIKIGKKTLEGSIGCFLACLILFYFVFPFVPELSHSLGTKWFPSLTIVMTSFVITLFELVPLKITKNISINDNLAVPIIAAYTMLIMEKIQ